MKKLIQKLLGIDKIIEHNNALKTQVINLQHRVNNQSASLDKIEKVVKVGVDHRPHHRESWAVICIPGRKQDIVEFIDLTGVDHRPLEQFLRQFKKENVTFDTPHRGMRQHFLRF